MLRPVLALLVLLSLACAGVDQPAYDQPAYDQPAQPTYDQPTQPSGTAPSTGTPLQPARPTGYGQPQAGAAPTGGYQIQGPVRGDDGAIMWVDSYGHITGMYIEGFLVFGMNDQLYWSRDQYGSWYAVQGQQLTPIAGMPQELMAWPGVQTMLPGGYVLPAPQTPPSVAGGGGGYDPSIQIAQNINDMYNETSQVIIDNMAPVTVDHYDENYQYIGTW